MKRRALRGGVTALSLYALVLVALLGCGLTDRLLLHPPSAPASATPGATRLAIESATGEIEVWRARSPLGEPRAFVLRFYGNADRADFHVASEASSLPFAAELWGVNYPGFGGSSGAASLRGVADSALIAYDAIKTHAGTRPILVFGTSMGTTAALHLAARRDVAGLVLQNPPPLRQVIRGQYGWWNLWLLAGPISWGVPEQLDSLANAGRARAPAVFVLSEEDDVVALRYQLAVRDAYHGPKHTLLIPGAKHNDPIPVETQHAIERDVAQILANGTL